MRILFRADASKDIGMGHIMRSMAMAGYFSELGHQCKLLSHALSDSLALRIKQLGVDILPELQSPIGIHNSELEILAELISDLEIDILVLDGYQFKTTYQKAVKSHGVRVVSIDDTAECHYFSDVVVNQNLGAELDLNYSVEPSTKLLLGAKYVLFHSEYRVQPRVVREIGDLAQRILVTFGGADFLNITPLALREINMLDQRKLEVRVIVGHYCQCLDQIQEIANDSPHHIEIVVATQKMKEMIEWADLAVCAAGSNVWELAICGVPMITGSIAKNQDLIMTNLSRCGAAVSVGYWPDLEPGKLASELDALVTDKIKRSSIAACCMRIVDGLGCQRVAAELGLECD